MIYSSRQQSVAIGKQLPVAIPEAEESGFGAAAQINVIRLLYGGMDIDTELDPRV